MKIKINPAFKQIKISSLKIILKYFIPYLKPHWKQLVVAMICVFGTIGMQLLRPWPIKVIFDFILIPSSKAKTSFLYPYFSNMNSTMILTLSCLAILGIVLLWGFFSYNQTFLTARVGQKVLFSLRRSLYSHLQRLSLSYHKSKKAGDLLVRLTGDINLLRNMLIDSILVLTRELLMISGMIVVMFTLEWKLTLISLAILPFLSLTLFRFSGKIKKSTRKQRRSEGKIASVASETLQSIAVVQSFSRESFEDKRFAEMNKSSLKAGLKTTRLEASLSRIVEIIIAFGICGVLWFGVQQVLRGSITPGDLLVFTSYATSMYRPLRRISRITTRISKAVVCGERIAEVFEAKREIKDRKDAITAPKFKGKISFKNVTFKFNSKQTILKNVTFYVQPGQVIGLTGPSGAGKSTIVSLILRLMDPTEGKILIDDINIKKFKLESLREQISVVLQDSVLFGVTIRENIAYGKPEASFDEIVKAAKQANAHDFITKLPKGYETIISERGDTLSGGEKQRIAIARAIIKNSPILILDEPTTGLDATAEAIITQALSRLMKGKTTFIVTHNLANLRNADMILVIRRGEIIEKGRHEELITAGSWYQKTFALQAQKQKLVKQNLYLRN